MADFSHHRGSCSHGRIRQVHLAFRVSHSSYKVPVCCGNTFFTLCQYTHVTAKTGTACGGRDYSLGFEKYIEESFVQCFPVNLLGCRNYQEPYICMHLSAT